VHVVDRPKNSLAVGTDLALYLYDALGHDALYAELRKSVGGEVYHRRAVYYRSERCRDPRKKRKWFLL
jgi:hypothetical protein